MFYCSFVGGILSSIPHLEELTVRVQDPVLSDQLLGFQPKLRKLTISGEKLRRIESNALDGLENCFHIDLAVTHTSIDDIPSKIFEKLQSATWARLDLSHNRLSSLDSFAFYPNPNRSVWFSRGTKILEGLYASMYVSISIFGSKDANTLFWSTLAMFKASHYRFIVFAAYADKTVWKRGGRQWERFN